MLGVYLLCTTRSKAIYIYYATYYNGMLPTIQVNESIDYVWLRVLNLKKASRQVKWAWRWESNADIAANLTTSYHY